MTVAPYCSRYALKPKDGEPELQTSVTNGLIAV